MTDPAGGHLSELALDRLHIDAPESDPGFFANARAHVAACEQCRAALEARVAADAAFTLGPPARVHVLRPRRGFTLVTTLAAAAAALLVARPWRDAPDDVRTKGGALSLRLQADDGGARRAVERKKLRRPTGAGGGERSGDRPEGGLAHGPLDGALRLER